MGEPSGLRRRHWQPTPVLLPGGSHGRRSLVGYSPRGRRESDTTEQFHFHFSLSCTGEGNGSPLQCSCLENPRDGGASWAAIYGVTQSWTRLKQLSSSSSGLQSRGSQKSWTQFNKLHLTGCWLSLVSPARSKAASCSCFLLTLGNAVQSHFHSPICPLPWPCSHICVVA